MKTYYEMTVSKKLKITDNKIKQNKSHYNLERQTTKTSSLSQGNVGKFEFVTGENAVSEAGLLEKSRYNIDL